jgi:hypothetical protein
MWLLVAGIAAAVLAVVTASVLGAFGGRNVPTGSIAARASASPVLLTVGVDGEAGTVLALSIRDRAGLMTARSATQAELRAHDFELSTANIVAKNLDDTHLLLIWSGSSCDQSATLDVETGLRSMTLHNGPRPKCDLLENARGVVFQLREPVRGDQVAVAVK